MSLGVSLGSGSRANGGRGRRGSRCGVSIRARFSASRRPENNRGTGHEFLRSVGRTVRRRIWLVGHARAVTENRRCQELREPRVQSIDTTSPMHVSSDAGLKECIALLPPFENASEHASLLWRHRSFSPRVEERSNSGAFWRARPKEN